MNVKALRKQLMAAIAVVVVAAVALSSATYAWFVSNNRVTATTTQISAQSNAAYLLIEAGSKTTTNSTTSDTAAETVGTGSGQTYADAALYPAQWKNNFDASKTTTGDKIYQFETAYASDKTKANEKTGTRFAVGDPSAAVTADYALLNTFYVGTGTYDGEFTNLKVSNMTVTATEDASLKTAMRLLIMAYAPDGSGNYGTTPTSWVVAKYNDGTTATIESQSLTGEGTAGVVYAPQFGKSEGDVKIEIYAYYDGADTQVYTTNLTKLTLCGATVTFDATPKEFK